jgi:hypothetical protein
MKRLKVFMFVLLALVMIVSCGSKSDSILYVSGLAEASFTQNDLEKMEMAESEYINKDDETTVFTGVPIINILTEAGSGDFAKVVIVALDGYAAEVTSEELKSCSGCILAFSEDNGWLAVMPGFSGKFQVKNVVELKME